MQVLQILGEKFLKTGKLDGKDAILEVDQDLSKNELIGLYFSASWCGPCQHFTPKLKNCYDKWKQQQEKSFEVVYLSNDHSEREFVSYFYQKMNWIAVSWADKMRLSLLQKIFRPQGIPTLVILDNEGKMITKDGKYDLELKGEGAYDYWKLLKKQQNQS